MSILDTKLTLEWATEHEACDEGVVEVRNAFPGRESITLRELLLCEDVELSNRIWAVARSEEVRDTEWRQAIGVEAARCGCGLFFCALEDLAAHRCVDESPDLALELLKMGGIE